MHATSQDFTQVRIVEYPQLLSTSFEIQVQSSAHLTEAITTSGKLYPVSAGTNYNKLILGIAFSLLMHIAVFFFLGELIQFSTYSSSESKTRQLEVRLQTPIPSEAPQTSTSKTTDISKTTALTEAKNSHTAGSKQKRQVLTLQLKHLLAKLLDVDPIVTGSCFFIKAEENDNHRLKCDSSALYEVLYKNQRQIAAALIDLHETDLTTSGFSAELVSSKIKIKIN